METKVIKEEVPDKEFPDTDRISSLRSRNKVSTGSNGKILTQSDRQTNCKTPDSPPENGGAHMGSGAATTTSSSATTTISSQQQQQSTTLNNLNTLHTTNNHSSLSPNNHNHSTNPANLVITQSQQQQQQQRTVVTNTTISPPLQRTGTGSTCTASGILVNGTTNNTVGTITSGGGGGGGIVCTGGSISPTLSSTLHHRGISPDHLVVTTTPPLSLTVDSNNLLSSVNNFVGHNTTRDSTGTAATTANNINNNTSYTNYNNQFRQLSKIKRFLCTLVQFGTDIGPDIAERVRNMVLNLVSSNLSIEEFHQALQDVTNFPLRPFVLPFLRTHLPLLQREVHSLARASKQTTLQYVRTHDHIILDPTFSPSEASEIFFSNDQVVSVVPKRRASDSFYENGVSSNTSNSIISSTMNPTQSAIDSTASLHDYSIPAKRQITSQYYQQNPFLLSNNHHSTFFLPNSTSHLATLNPNTLQSIPLSLDHYGTPQPTGTASINHPSSIQTNNNNTTNVPNKSDSEINDSTSSYRQFSINSLSSNVTTTTTNRGDEEWKNIHVMLNCILSMVEKTKRALTILQQRNNQDQTNDWLRKQDFGIDLKKTVNDIMIQAIRQTEDRVAEVKRKAEEAVSEVKKQAVVELQKAVQIAESKACELVANERAKMEKILLDSRKKMNDELLINQHPDVHDNSQSPPINTQPATSSQNSCWNCGRKANETCSGCNVARYCGAFCQHKDWENHHAVCCQQNNLSSTKLVSSMLATNTNKLTTSNQQSITNSNATSSSTISSRDSKTTQRNDSTSNNARSNTPVSSTNLNLSNQARSIRDGAERNSNVISK